MNEEMWYTHAMTQPLEKKELLPYVTAGMNLEDVTLSKISQS